MNKFIQLLRNDNILIIPTETVFGVGVDARSDVAVKKLYSIKKRPENKPLQIMVCDIEMAEKYTIFNDTALKLAKKYWPGSLTIILKAKKNSELPNNELSQFINTQNDTIALRVPDNKDVLRLIKMLDSPLAVTSANISNEQPISNSDDIKKIFANKVTIFDVNSQGYDNKSSDTNYSISGVASTIVDLTGDKIKFLREGTISRDEVLR